jgi:hypothetical protein
MTKNLNTLFPAINDEISDAFAGPSALAGRLLRVLTFMRRVHTRHGRCVVAAHLPHAAADEAAGWMAVPAMDTAMRVVARASNRAFTGPVLCRDQRFLDLNIHFTLQVVVSGAAIGLFPNFLKPCVPTSHLHTGAARGAGRAQAHRPVLHAGAESHPGGDGHSGAGDREAARGDAVVGEGLSGQACECGGLHRVPRRSLELLRTIVSRGSWTLPRATRCTTTTATCVCARVHRWAR